MGEEKGANGWSNVVSAREVRLKTKHSVHVTADYADGTSKVNTIDRDTLAGAFGGGLGSPIMKMFQGINPIVCITITRADVITKTLGIGRDN
jgi:hypothetical protein